MANEISISEEDCIGCGLCFEVCPATPGVFEMDDITAVVVHPEECERCMLCTENCPTDAIHLTASDDMVLGDI